MEKLVLALLPAALLCNVCAVAGAGSDYSMWYTDEEFVEETCERPCVDPSQCIADLTCRPEEVLQANANICGCCPGCVTPLPPGEPCEPEGVPCLEGSSCVDLEANDTVHNYTCVELSDSCQQTDPTITWTPACNPDGTFKVKQCKGDDRCFCVSPSNTRIFGFEWIENSQNMTCGCSRRVWELRTVHNRTDVSLHCTEGGDYEPLQCDDGLCWCAETKTGAPLSRVVPDTMMTLLPCYDKDKVGSGYLRQCDSWAIAKAHIEEAFYRHGTIKPNLPYVNCDWDGSYGFKQSDGYTCYCTWKDGTRLGSWMASVELIDKINCNCARDSRYVQEDGKGRTSLQCLSTGNYDPSQPDGNVKFCVDSDGYAITNTVPTAYKCEEQN